MGGYGMIQDLKGEKNKGPRERGIVLPLWEKGKRLQAGTEEKAPEGHIFNNQGSGNK